MRGAINITKSKGTSDFRDRLRAMHMLILDYASRVDRHKSCCYLYGWLKVNLRHFSAQVMLKN